MGNWSGDWSGGVSPSRWTGTPAILMKFMETKKSVGGSIMYVGVVYIELVPTAHTYMYNIVVEYHVAIVIV